jgi:hypothetical protein
MYPKFCEIVCDRVSCTVKLSYHRKKVGLYECPCFDTCSPHRTLYYNAGFLKLCYAYHQWYASHWLVVHRHWKKSKDKAIKDQTHTHTHTHTPHAQTMSSFRRNIFLFDTNSDSYFPYSCSTKKRWRYFCQHCVTVHKIIIGCIFGVLNYI